MADTIRTETDSRGVATLTLDRAAKHNAISAEMIADLTEAAQRLGRDPGVRAVVLAGEGKSFCAGGDLNWMREQIAADARGRSAQARAFALMLYALNTLPKPLIGRIHGNAFGGGVGLACVCDVAVAAEDAMFGLTETRLGLIPATIGPYVVARLGQAGARRVFMSSRRFGAAEACELGLVARAVAAGDLDAAVEAEVLPYLECAPGAVAAAKDLIARLSPQVDEAVIAETITALVNRWDSPEAGEGIAAFFEKRRPSWAEN